MQLELRGSRRVVAIVVSVVRGQNRVVSAENLTEDAFVTSYIEGLAARDIPHWLLSSRLLRVVLVCNLVFLLLETTVVLGRLFRVDRHLLGGFLAIRFIVDFNWSRLLFKNPVIELAISGAHSS